MARQVIDRWCVDRRYLVESKRVASEIDSYIMLGNLIGKKRTETADSEIADR